ncbi:enoyl-CoA hydratase/isomerase family protein [Tricladium varicosporioides]|nr:enoyl-CoA hydratase/isomerase family protein [Hymenoscyphus varicosporioides]
MPMDARTVHIPETYTTPTSSHVRISNYPESISGVTPILIVTLNRPEKFNAMTSDMINALEAFFRLVDLDNRVKCVVWTGAGKAFCSGIDLNIDLSRIKSIPATDLRDTGGSLALAIYNCSKTVIVAYNGLAVGVGMTASLAAGIRIASAKSEFGFPFSRIGLTTESASSFFLPRMVGYSRATYLLTTGKTYPADSKCLDGIFAETVLEPNGVLPRALELAQEIAEQVSPMAAYLNRQLIWRNARSAEEAHLIDSPLLFDMFGGRDHLEAKRAFFKKDKPKFVDELADNAPRIYPWWTEISVEKRPKAVTGGNSKL